jgi:hypothetical protein
MSPPSAALQDLRAAITRALEALHDGDDHFAVLILGGVADDLGELIAPGPPRWLACPECFRAFRWPGEVEHHRRFVHGSEGTHAA